MNERIVVGPVATNCWIVDWNESSILVDPGGDANSIIARLESRRRRISIILCTHGHFDHVAALTQVLAARTGDAPELCVHAADATYFGPLAHDVHIRDFLPIGAERFVEQFWHGVPSPTRLLSDGDRIGPFVVLHVPGHTPGSIAFLDEAAGELYSGDTLFRSGVGRSDLPGGDPLALERSLDRLLALPDAVRVYPGHGRSTTIAEERWG